MSAKWYTRPVLFVSDVEASLAFYIGKLGFAEAWRHAEDGPTLVAQVERAGCELILSSQWPDKAGSALIFISLDPAILAAARAEFEGRSVDVKDGWWGYKLMIVEDPDGNQLYFPYPKGRAAMSTYTATIRWKRDPSTDFPKGQYSRAHEWAFDGGLTVPASPSPGVVPAPWNDPNGVDPEEAFVASLSSCHMLFFVDYARRAGFVVDSYVDEAEGVLEKRADGKMAMTRVTLRPNIAFSGDKLPTADDIAQLHHRSHEDCFIANSVNTEVTIEQ